MAFGGLGSVDVRLNCAVLTDVLSETVVLDTESENDVLVLSYSHQPREIEMPG